MRPFSKLWERLLLYFPLLILGGLALGTYWLVRTTPAPAAATAVQAPKHEPDYFLERFSLRTFDAQGRLRSEIAGDSARHYPDTQVLEIDNIRIRSVDAAGRVTTAQALRGLTNQDNSEVQLIGQARVVRAPDALHPDTLGLEYRGEFLHAFLRTEQVRSHKPVELLRGRDRLTADRLDFDNVEQVMQLRGRVRATLLPHAR